MSILNDFFLIYSFSSKLLLTLEITKFSDEFPISHFPDPHQNNRAQQLTRDLVYQYNNLY